MKEYDATEEAYKNGYKQGVKDVIRFIDGKDKKSGKFSIYRKLLEEARERFYSENGDKEKGNFNDEK